MYSKGILGRDLFVECRIGFIEPMEAVVRGGGVDGVCEGDLMKLEILKFHIEMLNSLE